MSLQPHSKAEDRNFYSVANRTHEKAVAFAEKYGIEKVYNDIDELFKDENVDIIYISTPHNTHIKISSQGSCGRKACFVRKVDNAQFR